MRLVLQIISWLSLVLTVLPSILFMRGSMDLDQVKSLTMIATVVWFVATPFWMGREKKAAG